MTRVLRGDTEAFRPLVEAFEPAVFGLCRNLLFANEAEADDVTQETFVQAYRCLSSLKDRERFGPWLYQIARSFCRSRRRRHEAEQRALAARAEMLRLRQERDPEGSGLEATVSEVLAELPCEERQILRLRYFEGLSYDQIERRLGMTFSQVDHRIRRARARLAHRMTVRREREPTL